MKFYLAGPMSGIPQFNIPAFDLAAEQLRQNGRTVISPAELDAPAYREACLASTDGQRLPPGEDWTSLLARDVALITDHALVQACALLDGWYRSRGATIEASLLNRLGRPCFHVDPGLGGLLTRYAPGTIEHVTSSFWQCRFDHGES